MTRNSPSLWDGGVEWGDAETPGATAYWQDSETATEYEGRPVASVAIAGLRQTTPQSASWGMGQSEWLSELAPSSASFSFVGNVDAELNATVVVSVEVDDAQPETHPDPLWVGRVDSRRVTQDTAGNYWTTIGCVDVVGVLGEAQWIDTTAGTYTLLTLVPFLAESAGVQLEIVSDDFGFPPLDALTAPFPVLSVLAYINRAAKSSNALVAMQGDGTLRAVIRQALAGTVVTTPLTGADAQSTWTEETSLAGLVNVFRLGRDPDDLTYDAVPASIALYGERSYVLSDAMVPTFGEWSDLISGDAMAYPRPVVTNADFPVKDLSQRILWLDPLDFVEHDDDTWQVMTVRHGITADGSWRVTLTLDSTQNAIAAAAEPDPDPPPAPAETALVTVTYTATKSATIVDSGGGNGAGDYIAIGKYGGVVARGLVDWPIDWGGDFPGFIEVVKAEVTFRNTSQVWVARGSSPKVEVRAISESWSEGTFTGAPGSQYSSSNAVIWSGPSTVLTGKKVKSVPDANNTDWTVAITAIAQYWYDHGTHGLRIQSYDEDATSRTTEIYSDDHSTAGNRPELVLTCRVAV